MPDDAALFAGPETFQSGITLWYRGPEWAFAVPQGDLAALEELLVRCCAFWNGANSLIIPVRRDGRTAPGMSRLLDVHPVEACFAHDGVSEAAMEALAKRLGRQVMHWSRIWDGFDDREMHPLLLQPSYRAGGHEAPALDVPAMASERIQRIALACWGQLPEPDVASYRASFRRRAR